MKKNIWFVVLTYNPDVPALVKRIDSLRGQKVVLVDNSANSNDYPSRLTVIRTGKNFGYTGGMNVGIRHALGKGAEWVILLNDDVKLTQRAVDRLVAELAKSQPGLVGPFSGTLDPRRWTTIYPAKDKSRIDYLSGSCLAIHKDVIARIGMFYEPYFIYYEDVELCIRAKRAGFSIIQINLPGIFHKDGTVFGRGSKTQEYYLARNHLLFVLRQAPWRVKLYELIRLPKTFYDYWR